MFSTSCRFWNNHSRALYNNIQQQFIRRLTQLYDKQSQSQSQYQLYPTNTVMKNALVKMDENNNTINPYIFYSVCILYASTLAYYFYKR